MLTGRRAGWAALWQGHWGWILAETIQVYKGPIEPGSYFGRSKQVNGNMRYMGLMQGEPSSQPNMASPLSNNPRESPGLLSTVVTEKWTFI